MKTKRILSRLALLVVAMVLVIVGCKKDPEEVPEEKLATLTTNQVENITQTAAACGGNVTDDGGAKVTARGICWSTSKEPTTNDNTTYNGSGTGSFTSNISGLTSGTTYYVRAYAVNNKGTAYGEERSFTTEKKLEKPTVTTKVVNNISQTGALCGGNVTSDGNAAVTARGVCWSTSQNPTISSSKTTDGSGVGQYSSALNNLQPNTTYYVRAYATNSQGTAYGEQESFTTEIGVQTPTVTTSSVSNITGNSAVCGGNVTSDGNATVTSRGVCWSTSPNPMIGHNKTTDGSGTGSFTSNITGLLGSTTYYVRAYAINSKGTAYGSQTSFTTEVDIQQPTVTTSSVSNITVNSAVCGGNVTSDGGATVTARGVCWSTSQNPTISDNKTIDGNGIGNFTSNITGLFGSTTYYVRAYATNSRGTSYGTQYSFTTSQASTGSINGHYWVNLGLPSGIKWATCNVGASTPEGYGNYYAWGEPFTKIDYNSGNCSTYGVSMNDISGNASYDAARVNWGSTWRMPTKTEMEELVNNCSWIYTTQNGVDGYTVTGPNGNSIFLPDPSFDSYYWTSTPHETSDYYAYRLSLFNVNEHRVVSNLRYHKSMVRPVSN